MVLAGSNSDIEVFGQIGLAFGRGVNAKYQSNPIFGDEELKRIERSKIDLKSRTKNRNKRFLDDA